MNRRELLGCLIGMPASASLECLSLEKEEKPLAISVKVNGRIDGQQRQQIRKFVETAYSGTTLDGLPVIVSDDIAEISIVPDSGSGQTLNKM
jgi:hypothetical protein